MNTNRFRHNIHMRWLFTLIVMIFRLTSFAPAQANAVPVPISVNNLDQLQIVRTIRGPEEGITTLALRPDGAMLAYGNYQDNQIALVDPASGNPQQMLVGSEDAEQHVEQLAFSPDNRWLASWSKDNQVRIWDAETGVQTAAFTLEEVSQLLFSPDSATLYIARVSDPVQVVAWNIRTSAVITHFDGVFLGISVSKDGQWLAAGSRDDKLHVINVESGETEKSFAGHQGWVYATAFNPMGALLATGSDDNTIRLQDFSSGQTLHTLNGSESKIDVVHFSPDGQMLVSLDSGINHKRLPGGKVELSLSMSPNTRVARFWQVDTGEQIHLLEVDSGIYEMATNEEWSLMATHGKKGIIHIWAIPSDEESTTSPASDKTASISHPTETSTPSAASAILPTTIATATAAATPSPTRTTTTAPAATATATPISTNTIASRATATSTAAATLSPTSQGIADTSIAVPTATSTAAPDAVVQTAALNLREGPGTKYPILSVLHGGDELTVAGQTDNCNWLEVVTEAGETGWVSGLKQYIILSIPCAAIPPGEVRPLTGLLQRYGGRSGNGELLIKNGTDGDGVIVLMNVTEENYVAAYIRNDEDYTVTGIPSGEYQLFFAKGDRWSNESKSFTENVRRQRFEDQFTFTETIFTYSIWEVTLYGVVDGNASSVNVPADEFPVLR